MLWWFVRPYDYLTGTILPSIGMKASDCLKIKGLQYLCGKKWPPYIYGGRDY